MIKKLVLFLVVALLLSATEKNNLQKYYKMIDKDIKSYIKLQLQTSLENKKLVKKRIIDTLAKKLVHSAIYIKEEYISSEQDVFNNEIFKSLTKIYKSRLLDLEARYANNRKKLASLKKLIKQIKLKADSIKKQEQRIQRYGLFSKGSLINVALKVDEVIDNYAVSSYPISHISLDDIKPPLLKYNILNTQENHFLLLKHLGDDSVLSILDGKIVYMDKINNKYLIVIKHRNNLFSVYYNIAFLAKNIEIGSDIIKGEEIGKVNKVLFFRFLHGKKDINIKALLRD